jgi:asparagine synthase (glutamine-hydrolysing)
MCGIAGMVALGGDASLPSEEALEAMTSALVHRGPDQGGILVRPRGGLGARRLIVLDPGGGRQPLSDPGGRVHLVFNGEVYGFRELRQELEGLGHRFLSRCDSEVVLHAYLEWKDGFLDRLDGMFALALLDEREPGPRLFLARDRIGIKPLYHAVCGDWLLFGSEPGAILAARPELGLVVDPIALDQYLCLEYVPSPRTIFSRVRKLSPGHRLVIPLGGGASSRVPEPECYYRPPREPVLEGATRELGARLLEILADAVKRRLVSDVPLGVLLSGGIDSSTIAALACRAQGGVRTFSLRFSRGSYDETRFAVEVARHLGTDHTVIEMEEPGPEAIDDLLGPLLDPVADTSIFPTAALCRGAREHVTVALAGDGGDELFAGYDPYRADRIARWLSLVPQKMVQTMARLTARAVPPGPAKKGARNLLGRFLEGLLVDPALGHLRWMVHLYGEDRAAAFLPELRHFLAGRDPVDPLVLAGARARRGDPLDRALTIDLATWLPDDILTKVDRASMAASLEVRVPFLDHRLVELVSRYPSAAKLGPFARKKILRAAARELLPGRILSRRKQGFSSPLKHWLRGGLRPLLEELTADEGFFSGLGLSQRAWVRFRDEHDRGVRNHAHRLWPLLLLHRLLRRTAGSGPIRLDLEAGPPSGLA